MKATSKLIYIFFFFLTFSEISFSFYEKNSIEIDNLKLIFEKKINKGSYANIWLLKDQNTNVYAARIIDLEDKYSASSIYSMNLDDQINKKLLFFPYKIHTLAFENKFYEIQLMPLADYSLHELATNFQKMKNSFNVDIIDLAYKVLEDILFELDFLNQNRITHTDIKPENIAFSKNRNKFGLVDLDSLFSMPIKNQTYSKSDMFSAPEVFKNKLSSLSAYYSLALSLIELIDINQRCFKNGNLKEDELIDLLENSIDQSKLTVEQQKKFKTIKLFIYSSLNDNVGERLYSLELFFKFYNKKDYFKNLRSIVKENEFLNYFNYKNIKKSKEIKNNKLNSCISLF